MSRHVSSGALLWERCFDGLVVTDVTHAAAMSLGEHAHEVVTIGILLYGSVTERRSVDIAAQRPLEVFVRGPGCVHANQYGSDGARSLFVELAPDDRRARGVAAAEGLRLPELGPAAIRLARACRGELGPERREVPRAAHALVEAIHAWQRRPIPRWLESAREQLALQFRDPPSLAELAARVGVHPVHLARTFRARCGMTIGAFVRESRVFHAIERMEAGSSLASAALEAGFSDQSHMTRAIRAARGAPPGRLVRRRAPTSTCTA
jgi:AraC family transcriptional regulator